MADFQASNAIAKQLADEEARSPGARRAAADMAKRNALAEAEGKNATAKPMSGGGRGASGKTFFDALYSLADPGVLSAMIGSDMSQVLSTQGPDVRAKSPLNALADQRTTTTNLQNAGLAEQLKSARLQNNQASIKHVGAGFGSTSGVGGISHDQLLRNARSEGQLQNQLGLERISGENNLRAELEKRLLEEKIAQIKALLSGIIGGGIGGLGGKAAKMGKTQTTKNTSTATNTELHNVGGRPTAFSVPSSQTQEQTVSSGGMDLESLLNLFL